MDNLDLSFQNEKQDGGDRNERIEDSIHTPILQQTIKVSWKDILSKFSSRYDSVYMTKDRKAHFDCLNLVVDGAKERWKDLLLLDAIIAFTKEAILKGYKIQSNQVVQDASIETSNSADINAQSNSSDPKPMHRPRRHFDQHQTLLVCIYEAINDVISPGSSSSPLFASFESGTSNSEALGTNSSCKTYSNPEDCSLLPLSWWQRDVVNSYSQGRLTSVYNYTLSDIIYPWESITSMRAKLEEEERGLKSRGKRLKIIDNICSDETLALSFESLSSALLVCIVYSADYYDTSGRFRRDMKSGNGNSLLRAGGSEGETGVSCYVSDTIALTTSTGINAPRARSHQQSEPKSSYSRPSSSSQFNKKQKIINAKGYTTEDRRFESGNANNYAGGGLQPVLQAFEMTGANGFGYRNLNSINTFDENLESFSSNSYYPTNNSNYFNYNHDSTKSSTGIESRLIPLPLIDNENGYINYYPGNTNPYNPHPNTYPNSSTNQNQHIHKVRNYNSEYPNFDNSTEFTNDSYNNQNKIDASLHSDLLISTEIWKENSLHFDKYFDHHQHRQRTDECNTVINDKQMINNAWGSLCSIASMLEGGTSEKELTSFDCLVNASVSTLNTTPILPNSLSTVSIHPDNNTDDNNIDENYHNEEVTYNIDNEVNESSEGQDSCNINSNDIIMAKMSDVLESPHECKRFYCGYGMQEQEFQHSNPSIRMHFFPLRPGAIKGSWCRAGRVVCIYYDGVGEYNESNPPSIIDPSFLLPASMFPSAFRSVGVVVSLDYVISQYDLHNFERNTNYLLKDVIWVAVAGVVPLIITKRIKPNCNDNESGNGSPANIIDNKNDISKNYSDNANVERLSKYDVFYIDEFGHAVVDLDIHSSVTLKSATNLSHSLTPISQEGYEHCYNNDINTDTEETVDIESINQRQNHQRNNNIAGIIMSEFDLSNNHLNQFENNETIYKHNNNLVETDTIGIVSAYITSQAELSGRWNAFENLADKVLNLKHKMSQTINNLGSLCCEHEQILQEQSKQLKEQRLEIEILKSKLN